MGELVLFISKFSELCREPTELCMRMGIKIISLDNKEKRRFFPKITTVPTLRLTKEINKNTVHAYVFGVSQVMSWLGGLIKKDDEEEEEIEQTKIEDNLEEDVEKTEEIPSDLKRFLKDSKEVPLGSLKASSDDGGGVEEFKRSRS
jgi:hypothetical protein